MFIGEVMIDKILNTLHGADFLLTPSGGQQDGSRQLEFDRIHGSIVSHSK